MNKFDIDKIRADFPVLNTVMKGKPIAYLDNGATGLTPEPVIRTIEQYYRTSSCNIHRGIYELSEKTTEMFEDARVKVADFLHARGPDEIILTHGAT
ncbi:MAG: aminotransferase class V-fold PLP-dependent enzyme, partial [Sediminispirochaetaceae bacterium]